MGIKIGAPGAMLKRKGLAAGRLRIQGARASEHER